MTQRDDAVPRATHMLVRENNEPPGRTLPGLRLVTAVGKIAPLQRRVFDLVHRGFAPALTRVVFPFGCKGAACGSKRGNQNRSQQGKRKPSTSKKCTPTTVCAVGMFHEVHRKR